MESLTKHLPDIKNLPIVWHYTTPHNFECQAGCVCCCVGTLFFPSEAALLPQKITEHLYMSDGLIRAYRRPPGVCIFFDEHRPWHCCIPNYRPLRCQLYPYLPLVTSQQIVIVADPFCNVSYPETDQPEWFRCYGLGRGPDVTEEVEAMSREFLNKMVDEYPKLVVQYLLVDDVEATLNMKEVEKVHHPLFLDWDTEKVRQASRQGNGLVHNVTLRSLNERSDNYGR